uniref:Uncharacterized protein n=1 Tax=Aegilops tauschii subsp. strangulata TaxID=200361 RepID=A0A453R6R1_AEGTS
FPPIRRLPSLAQGCEAPNGERMMPLVAVLELSQEAKLQLKLVLDLSQGAKLLPHHQNLQQKERRRRK